MMTVYEIVKRYGLEKTRKSYKDQYGQCRDCDIPLTTLMESEVKSFTLYPFYDEVEITIIV